MPVGRVVSKEERTEIRKSLLEVLKCYSREELLAQWQDFVWGPFFKDHEKMQKAKIAFATLTDQEIIKRILDLDVKNIVEGLEKGY